MSRVYSGKPVRDTETAAESIININLTSSTLRKIKESSAHMSAAAQLQSDQQFDNLYEKRSKE